MSHLFWNWGCKRFPTNQSWQFFFLLSLKFKDPLSQRYEVELPPGVPQSKADNQSVLYIAEYQSDPFGFVVRRKSNGRVMWVVWFYLYSMHYSMHSCNCLNKLCFCWWNTFCACKWRNTSTKKRIELISSCSGACFFFPSCLSVQSEYYSCSSAVCWPVPSAVHHTGFFSCFWSWGALHLSSPGPKLDSFDSLEQRHGTSCESIALWDKVQLQNSLMKSKQFCPLCRFKQFCLF